MIQGSFYVFYEVFTASFVIKRFAINIQQFGVNCIDFPRSIITCNNGDINPGDLAVIQLDICRSNTAAEV